MNGLDRGGLGFANWVREVGAQEMAALGRLNVRAWALVALLFSAILPGIYLYAAAAVTPRR